MPRTDERLHGGVCSHDDDGSRGQAHARDYSRLHMARVDSSGRYAVLLAMGDASRDLLDSGATHYVHASDAGAIEVKLDERGWQRAKHVRESPAGGPAATRQAVACLKRDRAQRQFRVGLNRRGPHTERRVIKCAAAELERFQTRASLE